MFKLNLRELERLLNEMTDGMDNAVGKVESASTSAQEQIYKALLAQINKFEIIDGRFVVGQNYSARLAVITKQINDILVNVYKPSIREYLGHYATVDDITLSLHKSYNELLIDKQKLTPARRVVYDQAEYFLTDGLADAYIQPAKYLLMQAVTTGITIKDAESALRNWNDGEAVSGKLTSGRQVHRLQAYSTQVARQSIYSYQGSVQDIIAKEYNLDTFIYVGDIIKDSRPFCKHMVSLNRKIKLDEVPALLKRYPDGIIPDTTKKNFYINRGGYSCRHSAMPVKG